MSNKPTHTAFIVLNPKEGSDRNAQRIEIDAVWPYKNGNGLDLLIPERLSASGRIVCTERETSQPTEIPCGIECSTGEAS